MKSDLDQDQDDMFAGAADGMSAVAAGAEAACGGWCEMAADAIRRFASARPVPFTVEQARAGVAPELPEPPDLRAWGPAASLAIRRGWIQQTSRFAPARSSHGSPKRLYRAGRGW